MKYDGIIFDVDGTLWDVTDVVAKAWNQVLAAEGFSLRLTADDLKREFGRPLDVIISDLLPNESQDTYDRMLPLWFESEDRAIASNPPEPYEGITELFQTLSQKLPLYIVSNCQAGYIEAYLDATGHAPYIQDHLCPGDTGRLKAANISEIVQKHQLQHPVYVGDIQADCDASHKAGVDFILADYGFGTAKHPEAVIAAPLELLDLLD